MNSYTRIYVWIHKSVYTISYMNSVHELICKFMYMKNLNIMQSYLNSDEWIYIWIHYWIQAEFVIINSILILARGPNAGSEGAILYSSKNGIGPFLAGLPQPVPSPHTKQQMLPYSPLPLHLCLQLAPLVEIPLAISSSCTARTSETPSLPACSERKYAG